MAIEGFPIVGDHEAEYSRWGGIPVQLEVRCTCGAEIDFQEGLYPSVENSIGPWVDHLTDYYPVLIGTEDIIYEARQRHRETQEKYATALDFVATEIINDPQMYDESVLDSAKYILNNDDYPEVGNLRDYALERLGY